MSRRTDADTLAKLRAMLAGAELPPPGPPVPTPSPPPAPTPTARTRKPKPLAPPTVDLRALTNTKPHVRFPYSGPPPKTPAAAAKLRRTAMMQCECRLCALALYPPTTFGEYERLGLRAPSIARVRAEQDAFNSPRPITYATHLALVDMGMMP